MRTVLVCLLAALAVSANVPQPFKGQQSYVYRFDTQVASSLIGSSPNAIQQAAATRLRADVHISFTNDRHAKLQLQNVRLGELNAEMPKSQRVQPFEHFERREIPQDLQQTLQMPLSVSYVDGVVERINFHEEDSAWSKNLKRAVLNLIQVNLSGNDAQGLKMQSSVPQNEQEKNSNVFSIPEITLEGECETAYTVQQNLKNTQEDEQSTFNVTKTVNFDKCIRTADVAYGYESNPAQQLGCLNCMRQQKSQLDAQTAENVRYTHCQKECQPNKPNQENDIERSTVARFELVGKREKYAIKRTTIMSQYVVKAQNPASQNAVTQVVALSELTFKEQNQNSNMVPSFQQSSNDETLMYSPEWDLKEKRFYMAGDNEFEKNSPFKKVQKKAEKIAHALKSVLQQWGNKEQGYELDSALHFNRMVEVIRQSTVKEIHAIEQVVKSGSQQDGGDQCWCKNCNQQCQQQAQSFFMDSLAVAATRNSLQCLAEKIINQQVSSSKAVQCLQTFISNQHSPSEQQADILERIAKHETVNRSPALKQTAWLSFGSAVGSICQDQPAQGQKENFRVEEICPRGKKEHYKKTLVQQFQQAQSTYDQILALKAIGNAALDNTMEELKQIVKEQSQSTLIRIEAIDAMRRLRTSMPHKIRQALLPVFQNQREQPEVRMAAFSMIMYTQPEKSILDQLTFTVITDRSQNVKSFVFSNMEALSRSPCSAEQEAANHLKASLKMVKINVEQLRPSRKYRVPIYVSENQDTEEQNVFLGLASIVSPTNMLPIQLSASLQSALNGEPTQENLKVILSQKNLEQLYAKMAEFSEKYMKGSEDDQESMERQSAKDLRNVYTSLGIKSRRTGSYYLSSENSDEQNDNQQNQQGKNTPFGMIVIRSNDVDTLIVPVSENHMPQVVRKMLAQEKPRLAELEELTRMFGSHNQFQKNAAISMGEKKTKIPTTSGLPCAFIRQTTAVGSIEGQLKVEVGSNDLDSARGLTVHLNMHASGIATHMHKSEIWTPMVLSGVQSIRTVEVNSPFEAQLRADKTKVELSVRPTQQQKTRVLAIHTLPITFTAQFSMDSRSQREPRVQTVRNWALEHAQRDHHLSSQSNQCIQLEGHFHQISDPAQMLEAMYTTENNVHYYFDPSQGPKELKLRISGSAFQKHPEHQRPDMNSFYSSGSKGFQSIYEDDAENMNLDDNEQRQESLSSYQQKYSNKNSYKHEVKVMAEARYAQQTYRLSTDIKGACDSRLNHCKVFVNAECSPSQSQSQPWKLNAKLQTVAPEVIRQTENQDGKRQMRMLVQLDTKWGTNEENQLNVRLQAEPTKQKNSQNQGSNQQSNKWSRFLNKIDMVAEYQLQPQQKHQVIRLYEMVKAQLFWKLNTEQRQGEQGVVRATAVIDPNTRRYANITVQTPNERVRVQSIQVPMPVLATVAYPLERRQANLHSVSGLLQGMSSSVFGNAECRANDRQVRTFDGVAYKAPLSSCWTVLSKDCSEESRFVVLMKKTDQGKKVKIITRDSTIELSSQGENQKMQCKIDGQQVNDEEKLSEEGVELNSGNAYVSKSGVIVQFDGEDAKIKIGGQYKNIQCGLCGHYNDEDQDVFRQGNNQLSSDLKQFHQSYTLKNEDCEESQLNKFYQQDSDEFSVQSRSNNLRSSNLQDQWYDNDQDSDEQNQNSEESQWQKRGEQQDEQNIKPVQRTQIIEYNHKICFSTEPVKRCPRGSTADQDSQTKAVDAEFFCVQRTSSEGRQLLRQVRKGQTVNGENRSPAFVEKVEQPTKCLAYGA